MTPSSHSSTSVSPNDASLFGTDPSGWDVLRRHPVAPWFRDAKFGIFIHWGAYSVYGYRKNGRGYSEHVPKMLYREKDHYYPHWQERFGAAPPEHGYKDILPDFKAENWDPEAWAALFQEAGAGYVVLTAEHHDGYCLWDSALTPWTATKVGPMRDLVGDLCEAVRARGMKFAPSYHRERHPGFFAREQYGVTSEPFEDIAEEIRRMPEAASLYGPFTYDDAFIADYVARWKELQETYHPDFLWLDDIPTIRMNEGDPQMVKFQDAIRRMITDFVEEATARGQEVYFNNKGKVRNFPEGCGCLEKDNLHLETVGPAWQSCTTLGTSFGYLAAEDEGDVAAYPSAASLIRKLCDIVSKNGNFLLNIGPRPDGTIPEGMQDRLRAIGRWLKVNGDAIYGTRPWKATGQKEPELCFTCKGKVVNVLRMSPSSEPFTVDAFDGGDVQQVRSATLRGTDQPVSWEATPGGLRLVPPAVDMDEPVLSYRIEMTSDQERYAALADDLGDEVLDFTDHTDLEGNA